MTIACDIGLAPKQSVDQYALSNLYDQCEIPSRLSQTQTSRKKRNDKNDSDVSKITLSKTINISSRETKEISNAFKYHSFAISFLVTAMFLL